jgi:predicted small lipoprotein YifL
MKTFFAPALVAGFLALAACGGKGDDTLGDNVADQAEAQAENMEVMADNMSGTAEDDMEANAEAVRESGEAAEEQIDEADVNAASVNAM